MNVDMTAGSPSRILLQFSLPMLLSVVFQQMYNIVDSVVVGRFVGMEALAAVGASFPITMIFMAVATGSNIGCCVIISQLFGARAYEKLKTAISTSLISILILSSILTAWGLMTCNTLIQLLNTPTNIFIDSVLYLRIYIIGLLFLYLYNICTGIFTALGDSRTPLYFLILSSLINIGLDLLFVVGFKQGVGGAAWATLIAQGLSSVLALVALKKRLKIIKTQHYKLFSGEMLWHIAKVAIPSILQQSFISVGNLIIQGLINTFGAAVVAGYSAAMRLNTFALTSFTTLGNGLSSFTAQHIGANKKERIPKGFRAGFLISLCVILPFSLIYFFTGPSLMKFFVDASEQEVVQVGTLFLRIVSPFYLAIGIKLLADGILRGAGAMLTFMIATFTDLILRVILSFKLATLWGSTGIWISWPVGWIIGAILSFGFYLSGLWKKSCKLNVKEEAI
ncbi:MATE family efflux transporter [Sporanaerobium hydrogeniformans]|uniref:MATE family efflux transporter n=1 Tax=Sporanaerobium hydrogeniformans TaxID=3072179 RepID=A0AC61D9S3_9FIRM|nr:MATE family efflux transporter [Sporanaerobium hydrogeniformans]PHV69433.1 MATE family efflux transporter [Sporanaerobium hydrogeniformans]